MYFNSYFFDRKYTCNPGTDIVLCISTLLLQSSILVGYNEITLFADGFFD